MKILIVFSMITLLAVLFLVSACGPAVTVPITPISFEMDFNPVAVDKRDSRQLSGLERLTIDIPAMSQLRGFSVQSLTPNLTAYLEELIGNFDFEIFFSKDGYSTALDSLFAQGTVQRGSNQFSPDRNAPGLQNLVNSLNPDRSERIYVSVKHNYWGVQRVRGNMEVSGNAKVGLDLFR